MQKKILFLCLATFVTIILSSSTVFAFRQQSVGVRGKLMCGSMPLANTKVKLWNKNRLGIILLRFCFGYFKRFFYIGRDDQLADAKTDANGNFQLDGGIGSIFGMNVRF